MRHPVDPYVDDLPLIVKILWIPLLAAADPTDALLLGELQPLKLFLRDCDLDFLAPGFITLNTTPLRVRIVLRMQGGISKTPSTIQMKKTNTASFNQGFLRNTP